MFIEDIFGSESKIKILRSLTEINSSFTLKDLENETKLSRGILHKEVKKLENDKIILSIQEKKKLKFYRLNFDNKYSDTIIQLFQKEKIHERKGNKVLLPTWNLLHSLTKKAVSEYENDLISLVLFGSTARGTSTLYSDIDLLAIITNDTNQDKLREIINKSQKKIKNKINLIIMKEEDFLYAQKQKTTFIQEINKDSIDLYNNLIENTRKILEPERFQLRKSRLGVNKLG